MSDLPLDAQITFLYVRDMRRSAEFYEDILGFPLALNQGSCRIYRVLRDKSYLGICSRELPDVNPESIIFTLVTQDVDGWYLRITEQGWQCEHPPRMNERFQVYHFFVRDPDGYRLEVQRFAKLDWDRNV